MRYVLFICNDPTGEPYDAEHDDVGEWVEALQASDSYVLGDRLRPVEDATTVRVRGGERIVADGPFTESREWIAGFDIVEAEDLDAAIVIAAAHPMARFGLVEVRPVWPL
ncbi:YciI family protein [Agrococcus sp. Marseille-P2731]|uniref:YciI family protein n=1 Tax=Agrococcus sp. Marseille-P2731 TaxID=1841862 RepID=UPI000930A6D1|nr:YciI family protein [Agrococcus sp. Marseille-P2731]